MTPLLIPHNDALYTIEELPSDEPNVRRFRYLYLGAAVSDTCDKINPPPPIDIG